MNELKINKKEYLLLNELNVNFVRADGRVLALVFRSAVYRWYRLLSLKLFSKYLQSDLHTPSIDHMSELALLPFSKMKMKEMYCGIFKSMVM